ncbi:ATP synthase subunit I [Alteromonas oceanisediminis]|uniref:ATP synthase subunit I n=1 Tax=Alteromonas oceanisediminis TaxID=2836180 RepID=UPI001BDA2C61|nr:ATP synthase subunit I [Alteromonas oceanisediminis]MBT0586721.1 ATP synthase subunit I [Alteromonas oceanisediminis]
MDDLAKQGKKLAFRAAVAQMWVFLVMLLVVFFFSPDGLSAIVIGSLTSIVSNGVLAFFSFRFSGARQSDAVAKSIGKGMRLKFVFCVIGFVVAFGLVHAKPLLVFLAFMTTTLSYWLTVFWLTKRSIV